MAKKTSKNLAKAAREIKTAARHYKKAVKQAKKSHSGKAARQVNLGRVSSHAAEDHGLEGTKENPKERRQKRADADADGIV